jgi:adenosylhomocysteinase
MPSTDYDVRDLQQAEEGRDAIRRAEAEMPGLMALRRRDQGDPPLGGARITGSLHATVETAVLVETLVALGAQVRWSSCNVFSTHDPAAAALAAAGVPIFAKKGMDLAAYWRALDRAVVFPDGEGPDLIVDDGGDATWYLHAGARLEAGEPRPAAGSEDERQGWAQVEARRAASPGFFTRALARLKGVSEETTTGVRRLEALFAQGGLRVPAINVNDSVTKSKLDNIYGCRESLVDALKRATDLMLSGKVAVVCGFGDVGKGCAEALAAHRCQVWVTEVDPLCALQAAMSGYRVATLETALPHADFIITATGNRDVVTLEHLQRAKPGAVVANIGHFDCEIQVAALNAAPGVTRRTVKPGLDRYTWPAGRELYLLAEGRLVNLACATGHPAFVMSCSFTNQVLAQLALWRTPHPVGVHRLPKALDEEVARLHLPHLGAELTALTEAQAAYLGVPRQGPFKPEHYRY